MPKSQAIDKETTQRPGFLLIDKPAGMTSHDVVDRVRRLLRPPNNGSWKLEVGGRNRILERNNHLQLPTSNLQPPKVGHTGTLDPFATGLLIVGVGRAATREMQKLVGLDKEYEAVFVLGASSTTDDTEGVITPAPLSSLPLAKGELEGVVSQFIGEIEQIPPTYSAIKVGGKKMYEAAREGKPIEGKARKVTVHALDISLIGSVGLIGSISKIRAHIRCSSGTYIRSLARDLGRALEGGGYVEQLRRTSIGPFLVKEAVTLDELGSRRLPADAEALAGRHPAPDRRLKPAAIIPVSDFLSKL